MLADILVILAENFIVGVKVADKSNVPFDVCAPEPERTDEFVDSRDAIGIQVVAAFKFDNGLLKFVLKYRSWRRTEAGLGADLEICSSDTENFQVANFQEPFCGADCRVLGWKLPPVTNHRLVQVLSFSNVLAHLIIRDVRSLLLLLGFYHLI